MFNKLYFNRKKARKVCKSDLVAVIAGHQDKCNVHNNIHASIKHSSGVRCVEMLQEGFMNTIRMCPFLFSIYKHLL